MALWIGRRVVDGGAGGGLSAMASSDAASEEDLLLEALDARAGVVANRSAMLAAESSAWGLGGGGGGDGGDIHAIRHENRYASWQRQLLSIEQTLLTKSESKLIMEDKARNGA